MPTNDSQHPDRIVVLEEGRWAVGIKAATTGDRRRLDLRLMGWIGWAWQYKRIAIMVPPEKAAEFAEAVAEVVSNMETERAEGDRAG